VLSIGWTIVAVVLAVLITAWITFTATRLDRLHARVDAAQAALDAQLVRRAAAVQRLADRAGSSIDRVTRERAEAAAAWALEADDGAKEAAENAVGRAVTELMDHAAALPPEAAAALPEVTESATRVVIARRFYNDAVRDTRTLRGRRMPRMLHLAGHRDNPQFFDIDDSMRWT
jgi:hypothetical protein